MAGGGLSWRNNIPVTPGETLTLDFTVSLTDTYNGGSSRLLRDSTVLCIAYAGGWDPNAVAYLRYGFGGKRASSINDGGGDGGFGRNIAKIKGNAGGGAGGYLGKGGDAQSDLTTDTAGDAGSGSGSGARSTTATWRKGGDIGLYGVGITGASAPTSGQYNGKDGSPAPAVVMCGGGVGYHDRLFNGGIRIIWGEDYSYPYNAVAK